MITSQHQYPKHLSPIFAFRSLTPLSNDPKDEPKAPEPDEKDKFPDEGDEVENLPPIQPDVDPLERKNPDVDDLEENIPLQEEDEQEDDPESLLDDDPIPSGQTIVVERRTGKDEF